MSEETRRLAFIKNQLNEKFTLFFVTWSELKQTNRTVPITIEFNANSLNWMTGIDVEFGNEKRIFSIELPHQWSNLMNRPNQPEISIRWTAVKFSKLTISDRHDDSKWSKTSFKLNKHTHKVGIFNTKDRTISLTLDNDQFDYTLASKKASDFTLTEADSTMSRKLPVTQVTTGKHFVFDTKCQDCFLFLEMDKQGLYQKSRCIRSEPIKFKLWYYQNSWMDITKSGILSFSSGLIESQSGVLELAGQHDQTEYVQASFMNYELQVPVPIWTLDDITLASSDEILNKLGYCESHSTNDLEAMPETFYQFSKIDMVGHYSSSFGKSTLRTKIKNFACENCKSLIYKGDLYISAESMGQVQISLACKNSAELSLQTAEEMVTISGLVNEEVQMSDTSLLSRNIYSKAEILNFDDAKVTPGKRCVSNASILYENLSTIEVLEESFEAIQKDQNYEFIIPALSILLSIFSLCLVYLLTKIIHRKSFSQRNRGQYQQYEFVQQQ